MKGFMELTDARSGKKVSINTNKITHIAQWEHGSKIFTPMNCIMVEESYEEVKERLFEPDWFNQLVEEIKNDALTKKQKVLLLRLSILYSELAQEASEDEAFFNYLGEWATFLPMSLEDMASAWRNVVDPKG